MRIFYWLSYCGTSSAEILVSKFNKNHQNIIYHNSSLNIEEKRIPLQFILMPQTSPMRRHDPNPYWCAKESDYRLVARHEA